MSRRLANISLAFAGVGLLGIGGITGMLGSGQLGPGEDAMAIAAMAAALGVAGLWAAASAIEILFERVEKLRTLVVMLRGDGTDVFPKIDDPEDEIGMLTRNIAGFVDRVGTTERLQERRLAAVLAAIEEGIVVVTGNGRITLASARARAAFGNHALTVGTSVFDVIDDRDFARALTEARESQRTVQAVFHTPQGLEIEAEVADLGDVGGAVLSFPTGAHVHSPAGLDLDFSLHDEPPPIEPITDDTPLSMLHAWVFDMETTGLDVRNDRVVSVGALRLHGPRIYRHHFVDLLVNPEMPIPPQSTAIHGITDQIAADAPTFREQLPHFITKLQEAVVVGHNVGFDITIVERLAKELGVPFRRPPTLDTAHLVYALEPKRMDLNLEAIMDDYGLPSIGRHTALGDCISTAELFVRLLPRMAELGIRTFGQARSFAATATAVISRQRSAGW